MACVVEPDPETPATEAAGRRSLLRLARVRAHDHEPLMKALAIKQFYNICKSNTEGYVKLIFTFHLQKSERKEARSSRLRILRSALVPYVTEKLVSLLPI